jgi:hypothetical protein
LWQKIATGGGQGLVQPSLLRGLFGQPRQEQLRIDADDRPASRVELPLAGAEQCLIGGDPLGGRRLFRHIAAIARIVADIVVARDHPVGRVEAFHRLLGKHQVVRAGRSLHRQIPGMDHEVGLGCVGEVGRDLVIAHELGVQTRQMGVADLDDTERSQSKSSCGLGGEIASPHVSRMTE